HERGALSRLLGADHLRLDAEGAREGGVPLELHHALAGAGDTDAAAALPSRGLARLRLEAAVEIGAVADELGQVAGGAELAHEPPRVPLRPPGESSFLEEAPLGPAEPRQVIGDARPHDPAPHDHRAGVGRQRHYWARFRARSKISKFRRRRPEGSSPIRRLKTRGTDCSVMPPCERSGASSPERSCLAALVPMTVWRAETAMR